MLRFVRLFNYARNLSLILVVCSFIFIGYGFYTGQLQKFLEERELFGDIMVAAFGMDEPPVSTFANEESESSTPISVDNPTKKHFLPIDQVLYIENIKGNVSAVMKDGSRVKYLKNSINSIWERLDEHADHTFFLTRYHIINCKYVKEYYTANQSEEGSNYVSFVKMTDGQEITIPKTQRQRFFDSMKNHSIYVEK